jgi:RNA polymerase sigma-70 factor (ECF subfamily)
MDNPAHCTAAVDSALSMSRVRDTEPAAGMAEVAALVQRTLGGDASAFEQLVMRYERRVFTLAMKLLASTDDAQDAAQEVFLRVFKYIHRFDIHKPIEPWLMQMTVNVCRNIGRNRQRRWDTFPATVEAEVAVAKDGGDPTAAFDEDQERQLLWRALDTLPEKERLAVILRDVDGLKTSEVAQILGSSETTVRSQVSRARVRMKEAIDEMMGGRL